MFAVIYTFEVIEGKEKIFIRSWEELTALILKHEGSKGSRLHKKEDGTYLAYALWPDRSTWEKAGSKLPEEADKWRQDMRSSCRKIETSFELDVVSDLLQRP